MPVAAAAGWLAELATGRVNVETRKPLAILWIQIKRGAL